MLYMVAMLQPPRNPERAWRVFPVWVLLVVVAILSTPGWSHCAPGTGRNGAGLTFLTINYPPLAYYEHGQLTGFGTDLIRAMMERTGDFGTLDMGAFSDVYARAGEEPDTAMFPLSRVPARENTFHWVGPLLVEEVSLYARKGGGMRLHDLESTRHVRGIATVRGYASHRYLESLGFTNLVPHDGPSQCANSLDMGQVDLWLSSDVTMASLARQADVDPSQFRKVLTVVEFPAYLAFSVSTQPEVVSRWRIALREMQQDGSLTRIRNEWQPRLDSGVGPMLTAPGVLALSPEEKAWVEKAGPLRVGVRMDREPWDYVDEGRHSGLAADLLALLSKRSGLVFEPVPMYSADQIREALRTGEIDLAASLAPRGSDGLLYTDAYAEFPHVVVVRKDGPVITWLDELAGKSVAVSRDGVVLRLLGVGYGAVHMVRFNSEGEALKAVSRGEVFAYVGSLASVGHFLRELGLDDLRVSGNTGLEPHRLALGVRSDFPLLHSVLSKILLAIGSEERQRLLDKSIIPVDRSNGETPALGIWFMVVVAGCTVALAVLGGWVILLRRELLACRREEEGYVKTEMRMVRLLRGARLGMFTADAGTGRLLEADKQFAAMLGHDDFDDFADEVRLPGVAGDYHSDAEGMEWLHDDGFRDMCVALRHRDGSTLWVRLAGYTFRDGTRIRGLAQDVSDMMRTQEDLRRMDEEWQVILDAIPFHVGLQGTDRRFRKLNAAGARLLGLSRDRILGAHIGDVVPEDVWRLLKSAEDKALSGKMAEMDIQTDYARRDGCYRAYYSPHMDAFGMVHGFVCCLIDVTDRRRAERALADSEERYRLTVEQAHDAIVIASMDGTVLYGNSSAETLFGISLSQARGMSFRRFVHEDDRDMIATFLGKTGSFTYGVRMLSSDGRTLYVENSRSIIQYGGSPAILIHIRDVTEGKLAVDGLRENEQRLQLALDSTEYGMWEIWLDEGTVHLPPRVFCDNFGYAEDEAVLPLNRAEEYIHPEDLPRMRGRLQSGFSDGSGAARHELRIRDGKGGWRWVQAFGRVVERDEDGMPLRLLGMVQDVTERKRTEAKLRELATTDPLTGLANRRSFMDTALREFRRALRYGTYLSLLMLDLDHFKNVNDTYGHDVGDDVLCALAEAMRGALRDVDTPGRLGGEEFAVLLPQTGIDMATSAAERLREWMSSTGVLARDGSEVRCTVSIGVVQAVEGEELKDFLARADKAMYEAKTKGRNRVVVHEA